MVKFGRHVQAFLDGEHLGSDLFVVPYTEIRDVIEKKKDDDRKRASGEALLNYCWFAPPSEKFESEWRRALHNASEDFDAATRRFWRRIFHHIGHEADSRGALPDAALRMYLRSASEEECQEMLSRLKMIHSTAVTNAEALRKLVKKFDKAEKDEHLSPVLLPEVYSANFTLGITTLEAGMTLLRTALGLDDDGDYDGDIDPHPSFEEDEDPTDRTERTFLTRNKRSADDLTVDARLSELKWLKELVQSLPTDQAGKMVSHRGFHWPSDRSDTRPIENSLQAYEAAWTSGIHLCECDIALTKDERIILCHDDTFSRLALDPSSPMTNMKVRDLTLRELMSIPLRTGVRPPLLIDVLQSARAIGDHAKLVVEIKPGNPEVSPALARLFIRHPELCAQCAVVMSFDAFAMHSLRKELKGMDETMAVAEAAGVGFKQRVASIIIPTSMSLGNIGLRIDPCVALSPKRSSGAAVEEKKDEDDEFADGQLLMPALGSSPNPDSSGRFEVGLSISMNRLPTSTLKEAENDSAAGESTRHHHPHHTSITTRRSILPKLMLLTVSEPPDIPCKLFLDVDDTSKLDSWLRADDGSLDGVYMQYQPSMLTESGSEALRTLCRRHDVGVWEMVGRDPDDYATFSRLVDNGVSFVNSALPKRFRRKPSPRRVESMPV